MAKAKVKIIERRGTQRERTNGRAYYKPQSAEPPEVTNLAAASAAGQFLNLDPTKVGIIVKGRKHVDNAERNLRDKVIAHTPEGKRVFGFNELGQPVCFARKHSGGRCMQKNTHINGRCKAHGGRAKAGIEHWNAQHLRTADSLPRHMQADMRRAALDPDLLSLTHEIELFDLREKQLKSDLDVGLTQSADRAMEILINKLEGVIGTEKLTEELLEEIVSTWQSGKSQEITWKKLKDCAETRIRLVDSAHRREKDLRQMMRYDQAMTLVTAIGAACRSSVEKLIRDMEARYALVDKVTGQQVTRIDTSFAVNFMADIGTKLAKMISGAGFSRDGTNPTPIHADDITVEGTDLVPT